MKAVCIYFLFVAIIIALCSAAPMQITNAWQGLEEPITNPESNTALGGTNQEDVRVPLTNAYHNEESIGLPGLPRLESEYRGEYESSLGGGI